MEPNPSRVWVHTCNRDHPQALANYQARGMIVYKVEKEALAAALSSSGSCQLPLQKRLRKGRFADSGSLGFAPEKSKKFQFF